MAVMPYPHDWVSAFCSEHFLTENSYNAIVTLLEEFEASVEKRLEIIETVRQGELPKEAKKELIEFLTNVK